MDVDGIPPADGRTSGQSQQHRGALSLLHPHMHIWEVCHREKYIQRQYEANHQERLYGVRVGAITNDHSLP